MNWPFSPIAFSARSAFTADRTTDLPEVTDPEDGALE